MTVKRLDLDGWMRRARVLEETLEVGGYTPIAPLFHRPGKYLDKGLCWFELPDGRAFQYERTMFEYELRIERAKDVNARQRKALEDVVAQGLATKAQKQLLWDCRDEFCLRMTRFSARKMRIRVLKQLDARRKNR